MLKIYYTKKITGAGTTYMNIEQQELDQLISRLISLQSFMSELSLSTNSDIKEVVKWYNKPSKTLPHNRIFGKYNSPCSFTAGMINNLVYGQQKDCSLVQAEHLQNIINNAVALINEIKDMGFNLQKNQTYENIMFCEQLFEF